MNVQKVQKKAVICDLDETIFPGLTLKVVGKWLAQQGFVSKLLVFRLIWWLLLRKLGRLDRYHAFKAGVQFVKGWPEDVWQARLSEAYLATIKPAIDPAWRKRVAAWQKDYDYVIIATENLVDIGQLVADDFGFDDVLGSQLVVHDGKLTGHMVEPILVGEEKIVAVRNWAATNGVDLTESLSVGGHLDDLPLLETTGQAMVVDPSPELAAIAKEKGWKIAK